MRASVCADARDDVGGNGALGNAFSLGWGPPHATVVSCIAISVRARVGREYEAQGRAELCGPSMLGTEDSDRTL